MRKLGKKQLTLHLQQPLDAIPAAARAHRLTLADDGNELVYTYDTQGERTGITALLAAISASAGIAVQGSAIPRKARLKTSSSTW